MPRRLPGLLLGAAAALVAAAALADLLNLGLGLLGPSLKAAAAGLLGALLLVGVAKAIGHLVQRADR